MPPRGAASALRRESPARSPPMDRAAAALSSLAVLMGVLISRLAVLMGELIGSLAVLMGVLIGSLAVLMGVLISSLAVASKKCFL